MINKENVGKAITEQRKEKGLTQKELADRLHVSYQAVSKWELGKSLPTVELMHDIAEILGVTVDFLLNSEEIETRDICYMDTGLDTVNLYDMKQKLDHLVTKDNYIVHSHYADPVFYMMNPRKDSAGAVCTKMDIESCDDDETFFVMGTYVPGSKARMSREYGKDREICADITAKAINDFIRLGITPQVLHAHMVCGNKNNDQIYAMAESFKQSCESQGVDYSGLAISAQPINYLPDEYELNIALTGVVKKKDIISGREIAEGDSIIAVRTEGIPATSIPFIRVMLDRNRALSVEKIDGEHYFIDEVLRPLRCYRYLFDELREKHIIHGAVCVGNSFLHPGPFSIMKEDLSVVMNLSAIEVDSLHSFINHLDMVGTRYFPHRFGMGVGMLIFVSKEREKEALDIVNQYNGGYVLGRVEKNEKGSNDKNSQDKGGRSERVRTEGKIRWK